MSFHPYVAPVVALVGVYVLYVYLGRGQLGAEADWWERVRRGLLPVLDRFARRYGWGYAAYALSDDEYVGQLALAPETVETVLEAVGFERMPLAAFKYAPDGRGEEGSWARRDGHPVTATRQVHVILFAAGRRSDSHATDLYAHDEANALNPLTALQHYLGVGYDPAAGVAAVRELIRDRTGHTLSKG